MNQYPELSFKLKNYHDNQNFFELFAIVRFKEKTLLKRFKVNLTNVHEMAPMECFFTKFII